MLMLHLGPYPHVYKHRCINIHIHIHPNPYQNDNNKSIVNIPVKGVDVALGADDPYEPNVGNQANAGKQ